MSPWKFLKDYVLLLVAATVAVLLAWQLADILIAVTKWALNL